jgi:hypothetical protein
MSDNELLRWMVTLQAFHLWVLVWWFFWWNFRK